MRILICTCLVLLDTWVGDALVVLVTDFVIFFVLLLVLLIWFVLLVSVVLGVWLLVFGLFWVLFSLVCSRVPLSVVDLVFRFRCL